MSGPIVRKYGFPNFEQIFGERPLQHGVDEPQGEPAVDRKEEPAPPQKPESAANAQRRFPAKPESDGQ
jgi:hypothetical protein